MGNVILELAKAHVESRSNFWVDLLADAIVQAVISALTVYIAFYLGTNNERKRQEATRLEEDRRAFIEHGHQVVGMFTEFKADFMELVETVRQVGGASYSKYSSASFQEDYKRRHAQRIDTLNTLILTAGYTPFNETISRIQKWALKARGQHPSHEGKGMVPNSDKFERFHEMHMIEFGILHANILKQISLCRQGKAYKDIENLKIDVHFESE